MSEMMYTKKFLAKMSGTWGNEEFIESVSRATSLSIQNELQDIGAEATPLDETYAMSQLIQKATVLSFMTEKISNEAGTVDGLPEEATANVHRLAKLWESLSRICPPDARGMFALNAACAYELAGYQANARCMARQVDAGSGVSETVTLQKIVSAFLQRKFVGMRSYCEQFMDEPDYEQVKNIRHRLAMASAADGLYNFAGQMLSGTSSKIGSVVEDLDNAANLFHLSGFHTESSLTYSVKSLLGAMWSRSTWNKLVETGTSGFAWNRYLLLLARGLETPIPVGSSISEMWPSQLEAVRRGLLSSNESKIVRMPTSTGKTRIAEMSILHALTTGSGSTPRRCVYVAPYRALVTEVTRSLSLVFPDLGFSVSGMDGAYDATPLDTDVNKRPDILILTPEKLDIISRISPGSLDDIALFVIDEGHVVGQGMRGVRIEMLITRLRRRFAKSRFILLSAMLSDNAMHKFATWLRCKGSTQGGDGIITTDWRPTMQRIAKLEWTNKRFLLTYEPLKINLRQRETVADPITVHNFQYTVKYRKKTRQFPGQDKGEIAAELAFRYSSLGPILVYATSPKNVMSVARKLYDRIRLSGGTMEGPPRHFQDRVRRSTTVSSEWFGPEHTLTRLLQSGIAVHHGDLPHALRQAIELDVISGEINAIIATNTLSQGVNLPVRTIVVHSCRRYDKKVDRMVRIPDSEYWNLAGRAGRAGHETEGTVIHIVMTPSDATDFKHYISARDKYDEADSSLHNLLADLVQDRISSDDLARVMDPEILGIMVEEGVRDGCESIVKEVVVDSLAVQGKEDNPDVQKACERIEHLARNIGTGALESVDKDMLRAYGGTSLGMQSCARIREYVDENSDELSRLFAPNEAVSTYNLARMIINALGEVSEMDGELEYDGDRDALLESWMGGNTVHATLRKAGVKTEDVESRDVENAAKFIGTAFGHYAPWGISAFIRIAVARLGIAEDNLPDHVKYLPEMVRHGVPAPEHSWAMRLGVSDKLAAMRLCEQLRPSGPLDLIRMITEMGVEKLIEYGIKSDLAVDVTWTSRRMDPNPLLREGHSLEDVLSEPVRIIGIGRDQWYASRLVADDNVVIMRDYDDLSDRNALEAYVNDRHVGYIERHVAQYLAPLIDAGMQISAHVVSVERSGDDTSPLVRIKLSTHDRHESWRTTE